MSTKKKIVVTGAAGYIGSHTMIELLANPDNEVIAIDNFSNSREEIYDRIEAITGRTFKRVKIDLCDHTATDQFFKNEKEILGIINFAAFKSVPESVIQPGKYYYNNLNSLLNLLNACLEYQIPNFIFSSSCSVYGNITQLPVNESSVLNKAESPYAYTKQVGEEIIKDFCHAYPQLKAISLRYFNPVGAHLSGKIGELPLNKPSNLVPVITQTAIGKIKEMTVFGTDYNTRDGSCIRDYIHVTDIAIAHVKALEKLVNEKQGENHSVFNLGSGNGVTVFEAISSFEKVSGKKLNYTRGNRRPGDVEAIYSDSAKAEKELGWKPKFNLDQMMDSAWKWELNLKNAQ